VAKKKSTKKKSTKKRASKPKATVDPKFPYIANSNSLRQFLRDISNKPKPPKFTINVLETWGYTSTNDRRFIATMKTLGFFDASGVPTSKYDDFMNPSTGPATMAQAIRDVYAPFFVASNQPDQETSENLKRLFNLHSGGSERTLAFQLQTFKALCEFADFGADLSDPASGGGDASQQNSSTSGTQQHSGLPNVHIDLHIHLPENKSSRDYEAIIQDIARYIYRVDSHDNE